MATDCNLKKSDFIELSLRRMKEKYSQICLKCSRKLTCGYRSFNYSFNKIVKLKYLPYEIQVS